MKLILELKNKPKKDDVLVFDGEKFECINKDIFLNSVKADIFRSKDEINILNTHIEELKREIKILKGED